MSGPALPRPGNSLSDSAYVLTRAYRRLGDDRAIRRRRTIGKFQNRFQYGAGLAMGRRRRSTRRRCLSNFKRLAADAMKIRRLYFFRTSRFLKRARPIGLRRRRRLTPPPAIARLRLRVSAQVPAATMRATEAWWLPVRAQPRKFGAGAFRKFSKEPASTLQAAREVLASLPNHDHWGAQGGGKGP